MMERGVIGRENADIEPCSDDHCRSFQLLNSQETDVEAHLLAIRTKWWRC
jgi:hypothetical protein